MKVCDNLSIKHIVKKVEDPFLRGFPKFEILNVLCTIDTEAHFEVLAIYSGDNHIDLLLKDNTVLSVKAKSYTSSQEEYSHATP